MAIMISIHIYNIRVYVQGDKWFQKRSELVATALYDKRQPASFTDTKDKLGEYVYVIEMRRDTRSLFSYTHLIVYFIYI